MCVQERERERAFVCTRAQMAVYIVSKVWVYVGVSGERECVGMHASVCVCVCVKERDR